MRREVVAALSLVQEGQGVVDGRIIILNQIETVNRELGEDYSRRLGWLQGARDSDGDALPSPACQAPGFARGEAPGTRQSQGRRWRN